MLLDKINSASSLTRSAIRSANNDNWDESQSLVSQRDEELAILPKDFSRYTEQQQFELRVALQALEKINSELIDYTNSKRRDILKLHQDTTKSKTAINNYLDNA